VRVGAQAVQLLVQRTHREADGQENREGKNVCRLGGSKRLHMRDEEQPDEGG